MKIDIDTLSEAELIDLNHRVVERLRFLQQAHDHKAMLRFRIGERVAFDDRSGRETIGVIAKYNKKSVTVIGEDGHRWNVSPQLLRSLAPRPGDESTGRVVEGKRIERE